MFFADFADSAEVESKNVVSIRIPNCHVHQQLTYWVLSKVFCHVYLPRLKTPHIFLFQQSGVIVVINFNGTVYRAQMLPLHQSAIVFVLASRGQLLGAY